MGFWGSMFGMAAGAGKFGVKYGLGVRGGYTGGAQRLAIGAAGGAIYGGATSDFNTPEGMAGDVVKGALLGGALGAATTGAVWRGVTGMSASRAAARSAGNKARGNWFPAFRGYTAEAGRGLARNVRAGAGVAGVGYKVGRGALRLGLGAAERFPRLVGGTAVVGGGYALLTSGMADPARQMAYDQASPHMQAATPQRDAVNFRNSAAGVVQGLHSSRHGGW